MKDWASLKCLEIKQQESCLSKPFFRLSLYPIIPSLDGSTLASNQMVLFLKLDSWSGRIPANNRGRIPANNLEYLPIR